MNKTGTVDGRSYSNSSYDIGANSAGSVLSFGPQSVWELKYPNLDIIGRPADQQTAAAQGGGGGGY